MPDHLHMLIGILAMLFFRIWFVTSSESQREPQRSTGSEIFSITDCGMTRVKMKRLPTSGRILCEPA